MATTSSKSQTESCCHSKVAALSNPKFTERMTPSQKCLQGIPTRFLRRFWLTERAIPSPKYLQGTIIRSVNFGLV